MYHLEKLIMRGNVRCEDDWYQRLRKQVVLDFITTTLLKVWGAARQTHVKTPCLKASKIPLSFLTH